MRSMWLTYDKPLHWKSLPASLHVLTMRHLSAFYPCCTSCLEKRRKKTLMFSKNSNMLLCWPCVSCAHIEVRGIRIPPALMWKACLTPDSERASLLALLCLVRLWRPMRKLRLQPLPDSVHLSSSPKRHERLLCLPARERQHRPLHTVRRKR